MRFRTNLMARYEWRRNPNRTKIFINNYLKYIKKYKNIEDQVIIDLGYGKNNSLSISSAFVLNGAKKAYAIESDIVVSIGYPSTSLFEGVLLQKNVYLIKNEQINYKVNQKDIFDKTINVIELNNFIYKIKNDLIQQNNNKSYSNSNIQHFILDKTSSSARNISDEIL